MKNKLIRKLNRLTETDLENMLLDLYEFYYNFVAITYSNDVEAQHIQILADELTEIYLGSKNNLCVAMPPRHSKTSVVTLAFPLWLIFENPNLNILIVNAEASLSENFGIRLREFIKLYGAIFNVYLSDVKHSSTHIKFCDKNGVLYKGAIRLVGSNGSITGQDADYLILDDIYKGFSDITPTLLDKKIEWFKTMILQRKEPQTKLIILHTRWATNDLQGYLKENYPKDYNFISFPAIKKDGSPLWAERYSIEFLKQQLEEMGERLFSSIYQQKPLDETGSFFNLDNVIFHNEPFERSNKRMLVCRSWDLAYSDESKGIQRDSSAGVLMYCVDNTDEYVIADIEHGQYGEYLKQHLKAIADKDTANVPILIESGTVGGASKFLYKEYQSYLKGYRTHQSEPIGAKVDRATPFRQAVLDGKIHVYLTDDRVRGEFIKQIRSFPLGKHDDIVDACAYAFNWLKRRGGRAKIHVGHVDYSKRTKPHQKRNPLLRNHI